MENQRVSKFFRFTISGDDLDVEKIKAAVDFPCDIYRKGDTVHKSYMKDHVIVQKTNRFVYSSERCDGSVNDFLTENLLFVKSALPALKPFIGTNDCYAELVLYAGDKTDILLTAEQIRLLNELNIDFNISFC